MDFYINIARFHPLFVHLPIGIVIMAALLEGISWKTKKNDFDGAIRISLFIALLSALGSIGTGLLLADEGGYDLALIDRHKWSGFMLTGIIVLLIALSFHKEKMLTAFRSIMFLAMMCLTITGHLGGNLTHGSEYLFSKPVDQSVKLVDVQQAKAFESVIMPMLESKCNGCHNPSKAKGDLVMTEYAGILAGGKNGDVINFDSPLESELIARIHLPLEHDDHMPPDGKRQLTENEVAILAWWLEQNACEDCVVGELAQSEEIKGYLSAYNATEVSMESLDVDEVSDADMLGYLQAGFKLNRLFEGSSLLSLNLSNRQDVSKKLLGQLDDIAENIVDLDLSKSSLSDSESGLLSDFVNIQKLKLNNTTITSSAISKIAEMKYLESLNIYGTEVDDEVVASLTAMEALKRVYLWGTKVSEEGVAQLEKDNPKLTVSYQLDSEMFGEAKLNAPVIEVESSLFTDSAIVTLVSSFRNTRIYYTLDGSQPDSTSSLYTDPITIKSSLKLKTTARKDGWEPSPIDSITLVRGDVKVDKAVVLKQPHDKYKAGGAASLVDLKKGTTRFTDGLWLGYEGEDLNATLELTTAKDLSEVIVSTLSNQGSWIFHPKQIVVSTSSDGTNYQESGRLDIPVEQIIAQSEMRYLAVPVEASQVRFIKVDVIGVKANPDWHAAPGQKNWVFVDEILISSAD